MYERIGGRRDAHRHPAPGKLVWVGSHHLHLLCKGNASPTVVIEQGAGELSRFWWPIQDQIADFARVCTYDRAGFGWSEAVRRGRTVEERAEELHLLLANASVPGPYIFVAHSYGGLIVRRYAAMYRGEVAGIVLVDTPEESSIFRREVLDVYAKARTINQVVALAARFGVLRLLRHWIALDRYGFWLDGPAEYLALCDDLASLRRVPEAERISQPAGSLGAMPLAVITHGQPFPGPFAILDKNWSDGQERLATLSTDSVLIVAAKSNHMIQQDEPEVVLDAIQRVHDAASSQRRLS
jgi:pimeloyl-ACP methyl ester carboxylesterase